MGFRLPATADLEATHLNRHFPTRPLVCCILWPFGCIPTTLRCLRFCLSFVRLLSHGGTVWEQGQLRPILEVQEDPASQYLDGSLFDGALFGHESGTESKPYTAPPSSRLPQFHILLGGHTPSF